MSLKLPLTDDEYRGYIDRANPHEIPELVYALSRCQDVLEAIRREVMPPRKEMYTTVIQMLIAQIMNRTYPSEDKP